MTRRFPQTVRLLLLVHQSLWSISFFSTLLGQEVAEPTKSVLEKQISEADQRFLSFHGHYLHGDQLVLSYQINGREIDDKLLNLRWKRFAAGLYEPFGVKVVDGLIYVVCKDRLTRLHDFNNDGEADFYESFSADEDVSTYFHAFNFDLQTDAQGNFLLCKKWPIY